ncbi:hypothetical protein T439DRAFT_375743 [Meredithblackwellia eburnea MCA 4105]
MVSTSRLPAARLGIYIFLFIAALGLLITASYLLGYEIDKTRGGYNQPVPALLTAGGTLLIHLALFLTPIRGPAPKRTFFAGLRFELASLAVLDLFVLAGAVRLHVSTPGLMTYCGGFFICMGLQCVLVLAWLSWFFTSVQFIVLILATVYHYRRSRSSTIWIEPFLAFDWDIYTNRATRGHRGRQSIQIEGGKF